MLTNERAKMQQERAQVGAGGDEGRGTGADKRQGQDAAGVGPGGGRE